MAWARGHPLLDENGGQATLGAGSEGQGLSAGCSRHAWWDGLSPAIVGLIRTRGRLTTMPWAPYSCRAGRPPVRMNPACSGIRRPRAKPRGMDGQVAVRGDIANDCSPINGSLRGQPL